MIHVFICHTPANNKNNAPISKTSTQNECAHAEIVIHLSFTCFIVDVKIENDSCL